MGKPAVTVISPVYNDERYVASCVESCACQSLKDIEMIFVDDGSKDGSLEVLGGLANKEPRLKVISQNNAGAAAARNRALDEATGEFVFFIDSDDYIPDQFALETLYRAAKDNGVKIAGGSMCIDREGVVDFDSMHGSELDSFTDRAVVDYADYQYDYDFTRFIYSLDMLRESNIRFPLRTQFEDPIFHVKAMLAAGKFATDPVAVYAYRYGHQVRIWDERATVDRLKGIIELLELSSERSLAHLHRHVIGQLEKETTDVFLSHAGNMRVMGWLSRANGAIDCSLLQSADPSFDQDYYVIEPLEVLCDGYRKYDKIRNIPLVKAVFSIVKRLRG